MTSLVHESNLLVGGFACALVGYVIVKYLLEPLFFGRLSHIPGPKLAGLSWYYISYFDLQFRRNVKITEWHQKYGPVVRIRPNEVTLANVADYREIYDTKSRYDKTTYFKRFAMYGHDNLFSMVKYTDHQKMKRHVIAPYTKSNIAHNSVAIVRERVAAFLQEARSAPNGLVDFFVLSDCFSHDVMTHFLYGPSHGTDTTLDPTERPLVVNQKKSQIYTPIWVNCGWLSGSWILKLLLGADYAKLGDYGRDVELAIERKMAEHDADPAKDETFSLYRHMRQTGALSREFMASEMFDDLKAGQMTTASTFTYICWRLSKHPDWQKRLQDEVRALPVGDDGEVAITKLEYCPVLEAVMKETMRLHPVASGRQERIVPVGGRTYSGIFVPGGTTVIGPTLCLHHYPDVFPEPLAWRPERWLNADVAELKVMDLHYVPFGHGARICIGQHLAMLALRALITTLYRESTTERGPTATDDEMRMLGTLSAVPRGLRCELYVRKQ